MDVRYSDEQRALRDAAAQVVDRLGPRAVGELDDAERAAKLDAAVASSGWRELRTADESGAPWASAVEVAIVAEELGRGLADVAFLGPTLAAELRRLADAPTSTEAETVVLDPSLGGLAVDGGVAVDADGAARGLLLTPTKGLARVGIGGETTGADLTRPTVAVPAGASVTEVGGRSLSDAELARWTALGLSLTCADLVGTMAGAVQLACEYAA